MYRVLNELKSTEADNEIPPSESVKNNYKSCNNSNNNNNNKESLNKQVCHIKEEKVILNEEKQNNNKKTVKFAEEVKDEKKKSAIWDIDGLEEKAQDNEDELKEVVDITNNNDTAADVEVVFVPAPREKQTVLFKHTPRVFNTPMRESKREDEDEWIAKNLTHLKKQRQLNGIYIYIYTCILNYY